MFAFLGFLVGVITLLVNAYYRHRHARLEEAQLDFERDMRRKQEKRADELAQLKAEERRLRIQMLGCNKAVPMYDTEPASLEDLP